MTTSILTPVGRLVQGDCFKPFTKDATGRPLTIKNGPNVGQPTQKFVQAVAFAKTDPNWPALKAQLEAVARADFPALFPNGGPCIHPRFAMKVIDGDGVDDNGTLNSTKEGFAGHWVVRFSSTFAPDCYHAGKYDKAQVITDPNTIKRGYYVRVSATVKGNGDTAKPGLFLNANMIELAGYGDEITSGPDAAAAFGAAPAALPPGARPTPAGGLPPGAMPVPAPGAGGGYNPAHVAMPAAPVQPPPVAPPPVVVAPAPAFLQVPPPAVPAGPVMAGDAARNGWTYEQLRGLGHTDDAMRAKGWLA